MELENRKLKIIVLAGGISTEREISIQSGKCVAEALTEVGHDVLVADIAPDKLDILSEPDVDVFFIALHGEFGEDGQIQEILEERNLCYTGSNSHTSRIAINKVTANQYFANAGVAVPKGIEFTTEATVDGIKSISVDKLIVKPITHGSSVGVKIVDNTQAALDEAEDCYKKYGDCMIEQFIAGREITVGVLNGQPLPIIEIRPKVGFYDFHAKYIDDNTEYLFDTINDKAIVEKVSQDAVACYNSIGCWHAARIDFILTDEGRAYALEINTIPGMTTHSCVPKAAAKTGISMPQLCSDIAMQAFEDQRRNKHNKIQTIENGKKEEKENLSQNV